jgi:23S rRNA pseudouridine2605 synthase/16S rRNA pseudouridine516 synthase
MSAKVRINRWLASAGIGSRRKCDELIRAGLVSVNGETLTQLGTLVDPDLDSIAVEGCVIARADAPVVLVLNKPAGVLSTVADSFNRRTVIDLAREHGFLERLYPVGRLDLDTSGILLLTNDGDLAYRLTHPRFKIEKTYRLTVDGNVGDDSIAAIESGVEIGGYRTKPCKVAIVGRVSGATNLEVRLTEGRKRQIRLMFALFGHRTIELARTALGDLCFDDLVPGAMRLLSEHEGRRLRELAGLTRKGEE